MHLLHLRFCYLLAVTAAHPSTRGVDFKHDLHGLSRVLKKNGLEYRDHKIHRRIIVVQQYHLVLPGSTGLLPLFGESVDITLRLIFFVLLGGHVINQNENTLQGACSMPRKGWRYSDF